MGTEIERKYLVNEQVTPLLRDGVEFRQGYLADTREMAVRVRVAGDRAWLTVKGAGRGIVRPEFEYLIPVGDACSMLDDLVSGPIIRKTRYRLPHGDHVWEVDVFAGDNEGLIVAEVELASEHESVDLPAWVGSEVSDDYRYLNVNLVKKPFNQW
jgi:adenylate cyclase